jgi:hypothetical protein
MHAAYSNLVQTLYLLQLLLLSQTLFPGKSAHARPKHNHTPSSQSIRGGRSDHEVHRGGQDWSNSSTQLSLFVSAPLNVRLTFDLKLPMALPRFKSD